MSQAHEGGGPAPIDELNDGFVEFCKSIADDDLARKRVEVSVITFGPDARVAIDFTEGRDLQPQSFTADGGTPLGAALNIAAEELTSQKQAYKDAGLLYYRPWLFVITDGAPTDADEFEKAAKRVRQMEAAKGVNVFAVGVGSQANLTELEKLSDARPPLRLKGLKFRELFQWLSSSMMSVSDSTPPAHDGEGGVEGEQLALAPATWAEVAL